MKNLLPSLFLAILSTGAYAQNNVGINTVPDASAVLDVSSTEKGILVPRMSRDQRNLIGTPATGLMIFQTDNSPGFYFNSGTSVAPVWTAVSGTVLPSQSGHSGKVLTTNGTTLNWQTPAAGGGAIALSYNGFVSSGNNLGNGTYYANGSGWSLTEPDGHRVLVNPATTVKLVASMAGPVTAPYTLSLRKGTPSAGSYSYTDLSSSTISLSNSDIQTISLTGLTLVAGETISIKIVGTAALNAPNQLKTLNYSLLVQ